MTLEMKMDQRYEEGLKIGRTEGEYSRDQELIMKWIQKGKTITEIAEDLDKPIEYVKSIMTKTVEK